jgi:kinesin family protein C1
MEGPSNEFEKKDTMGIIPRSVEQIFHHVKELEEKGWVYSMEASFLEIYNENLRDLLGNDNQKKLEIKHVGGKTFVTDLSLHPVNNPNHVLGLLKKALQNRSVAETQCNDRSSRSHSVFLLKISGNNHITGDSCEGVLNLVDLAGSERLSVSGATGDRLKETQAINKSLSSLGDVITALGIHKIFFNYSKQRIVYSLQEFQVNVFASE